MLRLLNIINVWFCFGLRLNNIGERDFLWIFINVNVIYKVFLLVFNVKKVFIERRGIIIEKNNYIDVFCIIIVLVYIIFCENF